MGKRHKIMITFDEHCALVALPKKPRLRKGDTIRWDSPHGPVRINFPDNSPFGASGEVAGSTSHKVTAYRGTFKYGCGVTVKSGKHIGWPGKTTPGSGGEVVIEQ